MTHDEIIAVIAAHRDGKPLQQKGSVGWLNYKPASMEDLLFRLGRPMSTLTLRPKPEPRRVYVPFNAGDCTGVAYTDLASAESAWLDCEIVAFVEEASE
jgi:hypothetical protein